uniref:Uncharacterized protein n=1 Tax=Parascaris univalens TaxID=6257 RepID=A0A915ASS1_PARUN
MVSCNYRRITMGIITLVITHTYDDMVVLSSTIRFWLDEIHLKVG